MKRASAPICLAGSQLGETRHVCAFFNSDEEEYRVLLPFIKDGLKSGDKAVHVLNPGHSQDHPLVIIGGILQENPFFVPPDEFLREFRQRRAGRISSPATA